MPTGYKNIYPSIPSLCQCGCNEVVYGDRKYVLGHNLKKYPSRYWLGKHLSEEHKKKDSESKMGSIPWNKGNGEFLLPEIRAKCLRGLRNHILSEEERLKMSKSRMGCLNGNYVNGNYKKPYCYKFNGKLKEAIRFRDNNICQLCSKTKEQEGKCLSVHHIHYDKENCYPDLICLCNACNAKVNKKSLRKYYEELFMNKLNERELLFWTKRRNYGK